MVFCWMVAHHLRKELWFRDHARRLVGNGNIFIFGRMCGLAGCPLEIDLVDCLSCRCPNGCLFLICSS